MGKVYSIVPQDGTYTVELTDPEGTVDEGAGCIDECCAAVSIIRTVTLERVPEGGVKTDYSEHKVVKKTITRPPR